MSPRCGWDPGWDACPGVGVSWPLSHSLSVALGGNLPLEVGKIQIFGTRRWRALCVPSHPSLRGVPKIPVKREAGGGKHLPDIPPMHLPKNSNFWRAQCRSKVKFRLPLPEWTRNLSPGTNQLRNISAPPSAVASLGEKAAKKGLGSKN